MMAQNRQFNLLLPKPLQVGDEIEIDATIKKNADVFSISLCEDDEADMVIFHFKMYYDDKKGGFNTKFCGKWLTETWVEDTNTFPVQGSRVLIKFVIEESKIRTYINKYHFADYNLLTGLEDVQYCQIWEGLDKLYAFKMIFN